MRASRTRSPALRRVHVVEVELRCERPTRFYDQIARGIALHGVDVAAAFSSAKGVEVVVLSDLPPGEVERDVLLTAAYARVFPSWLRPSQLYSNNEMRPAEWSWLTDEAEVAARYGHRLCFPIQSEHDLQMCLPARGLRYPVGGRHAALWWVRDDAPRRVELQTEVANFCPTAPGGQVVKYVPIDVPDVPPLPSIELPDELKL